MANRVHRSGKGKFTMTKTNVEKEQCKMRVNTANLTKKKSDEYMNNTLFLSVRCF